MSRKPIGMLRAMLWLSCAAAGGCSNDDPNEEAGGAPTELISDQLHNQGAKGFFWLTPVVPTMPMTQGRFDPAQSPTLEIDELEPASPREAPRVARVVATYTTTSGPFGETVFVKERAQSYHVAWDTRRFATDPNRIYRARVIVGGEARGFVDIKVVRTKAELATVDASSFIAIVDGSRLALNWFANASAVPASPSEVVALQPGADPRP